MKDSLFYYFFQKGLLVWYTKAVSREIVQTFPGKKKILLKLSDKIWDEIFPAIFFFFVFLRILNIFNTYTEKGNKVFKKNL